MGVFEPALIQRLLQGLTLPQGTFTPATLASKVLDEARYLAEPILGECHITPNQLQDAPRDVFVADTTGHSYTVPQFVRRRPLFSLSSPEGGGKSDRTSIAQRIIDESSRSAEEWYRRGVTPSVIQSLYTLDKAKFVSVTKELMDLMVGRGRSAAIAVWRVYRVAYEREEYDLIKEFLVGLLGKVTSGREAAVTLHKIIYDLMGETQFGERSNFFAYVVLKLCGALGVFFDGLYELGFFRGEDEIPESTRDFFLRLVKLEDVFLAFEESEFERSRVPAARHVMYLEALRLYWYMMGDLFLEEASRGKLSVSDTKWMDVLKGVFDVLPRIVVNKAFERGVVIETSRWFDKDLEKGW